MFLFKAYSYGAIAEEEHVQSIELAQSFVAKLSQAANSDQHIAFGYSKLLRSLLRQGLANGKSQDNQGDYYLQTRASLSTQASPSPCIPPATAEGPVGQGPAPADRDSAMDLFHVSPRTHLTPLHPLVIRLYGRSRRVLQARSTIFRSRPFVEKGQTIWTS